MCPAGQETAHAVHAVRERVHARERREDPGEPLERIDRPREKEDRQHEEIHDHLKALHFLEARPDRGRERREDHGDEGDDEKGERHREDAHGAESRDEGHEEDQRALQHGDRGAAERAADHDRQARHRRDQSLFEKPKLAVPQHGDPGEHGGKEHRHPDHAGRHELEVAAFAGALKHRAEAEPERAQVHERSAERCHDLDARAQVFLHFPQPESEDDGHGLISSTRGRPAASGPRPWRSRPGSSCR